MKKTILLINTALFIMLVLFLSAISKADCPLGTGSNLSNAMYILNSTTYCRNISLEVLSNVELYCNGAIFNNSNETEPILFGENSNNVTIENCTFDKNSDYEEEDADTIGFLNISDFYFNYNNILFGNFLISKNVAESGYDNINLNHNLFSYFWMNDMTANTECVIDTFNDNYIHDEMALFNCQQFGNHNIYFYDSAQMFNAVANDTIALPNYFAINNFNSDYTNTTIYDLYFNSDNISLSINNAQSNDYLIRTGRYIIEFLNFSFTEANKTLNFYIDDIFQATYINISMFNITDNISAYYVVEEIFSLPTNETNETEPYTLDLLSFNFDYIGLYNTTVSILFNDTCNLNLSCNNQNYLRNNKTYFELDILPLSSDTFYNITLTCALSYDTNTTYGYTDTFKTRSTEELELELSQSKLTFILCIATIILLIILYVVGEIFFPAISILAGLGFMIYAFLSCFDYWWLKFLLIIIGLFMIAKAVAKFLWGES